MESFSSNFKIKNTKLLARTATSEVYRVDLFDKLEDNADKAVLKLLTKIGQEDESLGALALKSYDGKGAVKLYQSNDKVHILEFIDGKSLDSLIEEGKDRQAMQIIIENLSVLHATRTTKETQESLTSLERRFRSLFNIATKTEVMPIFKTGARCAELLLKTEQDKVLLHGDMHHGNLLFSDTRGWLAIDPKGLFGERAYDYANSLMNPINAPDTVQNLGRLTEFIDLICKRAKIKKERMIAYFFSHACLSASWTLEAKGDPAHALKMAQIIEPQVNANNI